MFDRVLIVPWNSDVICGLSVSKTILREISQSETIFAFITNVSAAIKKM